MNKGRVEAFSDAIIAIIITIMVLELEIPETITQHSLLEIAPSLIAYAASFTQIIMIWVAHHDVFSYMENLTKKIFVTNGLWLFILSFIPTITKALGRYSHDLSVVTLYIVVWLILDTSWHLLVTSVKQDNPALQKTTIGALSSHRTISYFIYLIALLIISYIFPPFSQWVSLLITVFTCYVLLSDSSLFIGQKNKEPKEI